MTILEQIKDTMKDKNQLIISKHKKKLIFIFSIILLLIGIILIILYKEKIELKIYFINSISFTLILIGSINLINILSK